MGMVVVVFAGEYDLACRDELRRYIDSTCITELIKMNAARKAKGYQSTAIVVKPRTAVRRIFDVAHLARVFNTVETLDEAVGKNGETTSVRYAFSGTYENEAVPIVFRGAVG